MRNGGVCRCRSSASRTATARRTRTSRSRDSRTSTARGTCSAIRSPHPRLPRWRRMRPPQPGPAKRSSASPCRPSRSIARLPTKSRRLLKSASPTTSVAITGGIGAGKSAALDAFARHGAATISSDEIVHRLLREDAEVHSALRERWGDDIVGPDGADRAAIAAIVFDNADELAWLEGLLHPKVVREYVTWREQQTAPVAVTEVPLLYE